MLGVGVAFWAAAVGRSDPVTIPATTMAAIRKQRICISSNPLILESFHVTPVIAASVTRFVHSAAAAMLGLSIIVGML